MKRREDGPVVQRQRRLVHIEVTMVRVHPGSFQCGSSGSVGNGRPLWLRPGDAVGSNPIESAWKIWKPGEDEIRNASAEHWRAQVAVTHPLRQWRFDSSSAHLVNLQSTDFEYSESFSRQIRQRPVLRVGSGCWFFKPVTQGSIPARAI